MSSISSYILAGYRRDTIKSSESAMKYFLLGSFATAFFLYGIALVYGVTGTTNLTQMANADTSGNLIKLGLALILIGLGFKVAAAPFQLWTPDVYEGAPTPVTALFSAGPKAATFALMLRIFATVPAATHFWFWAFWILAVAHDVRRQPRRARPDQRQAHAGLQLDRPRRLHPRRLCRRHLSPGQFRHRRICRLRCSSLLSPELRAGKTRRLHHRRPARGRRRKAPLARRLHRPRPPPARRRRGARASSCSRCWACPSPPDSSASSTSSRPPSIPTSSGSPS